MRIRELQINDSKRMLEWMHNPDLNQFFQTDFSAVKMDAARNFISRSKTKTNNELHLAITNYSDCYMGTVSLKNIDSQHRNAEYAISLCPDAIGKGYASFATKKILDIGFNQYSLIKIYLNVVRQNIRAVKFYEKFGFIKEGEFINHIIIRDNTYDLLWYRMLLSEYK